MNEKLIVLAIFIGFAIVELLSGQFLNRDKSKKKDVFVEVIATSIILAFTLPMVMTVSGWIGNTFAPELKNVWSSWSWPLMFLMFIICDDMLQYWWHRACHSPLLYGLHRAHHSANYMSIRVVYRNNLFYYMIMPSLWMSGFLIYLGLFEVYPYYIIIKLSIIYGAHSSIKWDRFLYSTPWLSPLAWIVERTISTPATHFAHHGMFVEDGITNYKGNFGNMLFFWDVLFGTAHITRQYPKNYGIENLPNSTWQQDLLWPLVNTVSNQLEQESLVNDAQKKP